MSGRKIYVTDNINTTISFKIRDENTPKELEKRIREKLGIDPIFRIRLFTKQGSLRNISPHLKQNTQNDPYIAEKVDCTKVRKSLFLNGEEEIKEDAIPPNPDLDITRKSVEEVAEVYKEYRALCERLDRDAHQGGSDSLISYDLLIGLKNISFNNWIRDSAELMTLVKFMFIDLDLLTKFDINTDRFDQWLIAVYARYNHVPFHNFFHAFMVTQMVYACIKNSKTLAMKFSSIQKLTLLISSVCHDLDHPGFNNAYQVNANTILSVRYNDISVLENHHCAATFDLLLNPDTNILGKLSDEDFNTVRGGVIKCLLATDMASHFRIIEEFKAVVKEGFDWESKEHQMMLMRMVVKVGDISNEIRPIECGRLWVESLLEEFFHQTDIEKEMDLPISPFMDRTKVVLPVNQYNFINHVTMPLVDAFRDFLPDLWKRLHKPLSHAKEFYRLMYKQRSDKEGREFAAMTKAGKHRIKVLWSHSNRPQKVKAFIDDTTGTSSAGDDEIQQQQQRNCKEDSGLSEDYYSDESNSRVGMLKLSRKSSKKLLRAPKAAVKNNKNHSCGTHHTYTHLRIRRIRVYTI